MLCGGDQVALGFSAINNTTKRKIVIYLKMKRLTAARAKGFTG
jgi:hypothetical protein